MPAASSSRRKASSKRRNSEDIEVDKPTQDQMDVVESDEDAPTRKRGIKQAKGKKPQRSDGENNDDGSDDDSEDDERIDVSNFKDQPIPKTRNGFLQGLASDWTTCDKIIRQNWNILNEIGAAIADAAEGDDEPSEIEELDTIMRELVDLSAKFQSNHDVLDGLYQKVSQGDEISDMLAQYLTGVKEQNNNYKAKTSRQKYSKMLEYIGFRTAIWEALHPDTPMPPLTNFFEKEPGDNSDDDDDLEVGGQTQDYKCPISLTLLVDPLTSSVCGHSYSAEAIKASFDPRNPGKAISCPAAGCHKKMTFSQCKPNPDLAKRVKAYGRRMARQDEFSDAEEVID